VNGGEASPSSSEGDPASRVAANDANIADPVPVQLGQCGLNIGDLEQGMNDLPPGDVVQVSRAMFLAGQEGPRASERQSVNLTGRVSGGGRSETPPSGWPPPAMTAISR
jgi:hypothetical protein